jgi:hypothetical protein
MATTVIIVGNEIVIDLWGTASQPTTSWAEVVTEVHQEENQ